jgi:DNA-binding transcriptional ArsR family regulator
MSNDLKSPPPAAERPRFVPPPPKAAPKMPSRKGELKQLLQLCASLELKSPERLVLAALYSFTDGYGFCYPGAETLLEMTGLSDRRIRTALDTLREVGVVPALKAERSGQYTFRKGGKSLRRGQSLFLVWPIATDTGKQHFIGMLKNAHPSFIDTPTVRAQAAQKSLLPLAGILRTAESHAKWAAEHPAPAPPQSATG